MIISNDVLRIICLCLFSMAWLLITIALTEEMWTRKDRQPGRLSLALRVVLWIARIKFIELLIFSFGYINRGAHGWPGLTPEQVQVSLANYSLVWTEISFTGFLLLFLAMSSSPTTRKETLRRARVRRARIELERRGARQRGN